VNALESMNYDKDANSEKLGQLEQLLKQGSPCERQFLKLYVPFNIQIRQAKSSEFSLRTIEARNFLP